jgi:hypothetical protein
MPGIWSSKSTGSIKSIQRGTCNYAGLGNNATATITAVDMNKSVVNDLGYLYGSYSSQGHSRIELTNNTTVTSYRPVPGGNDAGKHGFEVVEFL